MSRNEAAKKWKQRTAKDPKYRATRAWSRKKYECAKKKIMFDLEPIDFVPPETCPALGIPLLYSDGRKLTWNSPSLDRIDPDLGYVKGNIIIVSHLANSIKNNASPSQILKVAQFYLDLYSRLGLRD